MQIFHWFSFPNFPLVQFSLPNQVRFQHLSMAMLKTFMSGDLSVVYSMSHLCVVLHFLIFTGKLLICIHTYIQTEMNTSYWTDVCIHTHVYTSYWTITNVCTHIYIHTYICILITGQLLMSSYTYTCAYYSLYGYWCMHTHTYIYIYVTHTHTQTHMHTIYWKLSDMYTYTYTYTHICILVTGQLLISAHTHKHTHIHTCIWGWLRVVFVFCILCLYSVFCSILGAKC